MEGSKFEKMSVILLDVAGTTTAINFFENTLFPYVLKNVEEFLKDNWEDESVKKAVSELDQQNLDATKAAELVKNLTEKNDSNIGVKTIQGLLYKKGYETGELKAHVFPDVYKCLESWHKQTKKIAIFSSGSVESQELLFKNTIEGDLSKYISKYFDQTFGLKTETETYKKIAKDLEVDPENILFITDDVKEAEAAKSSELSVVLIKREGNAELPADTDFVIVDSFDEITSDSIKRKIEDENTEEPPTKIAKTEDIKEKTEEEPMEVTTGPQEEVSSSETPETSTTDKTEIPSEKTDAPVEKIETETPTEKTDETENSTEKTETPTEKVVTETETKDESGTTPMNGVSEETTEKSETEETKAVSDDNETKMEIGNIGTQTKTDTNECEVQTTISIKADKEIPVEEVCEKLTKSENGVEEKENNSELANGKGVEEDKTEQVGSTITGEDVQKSKIEEQNEPTPVSVVA